MVVQGIWTTHTADCSRISLDKSEKSLFLSWNLLWIAPGLTEYIKRKSWLTYSRKNSLASNNDGKWDLTVPEPASNTQRMKRNSEKTRKYVQNLRKDDKYQMITQFCPFLWISPSPERSLARGSVFDVSWVCLSYFITSIFDRWKRRYERFDSCPQEWINLELIRK